MKVSISIIVSFMNLLVHGEKLACRMIPIETNEGLYGHCCLYYKNTPNSSAFPQEEITQQVLRNNRRHPQPPPSSPATYNQPPSVMPTNQVYTQPPPTATRDYQPPSAMPTNQVYTQPPPDNKQERRRYQPPPSQAPTNQVMYNQPSQVYDQPPLTGGDKTNYRPSESAKESNKQQNRQNVTIQNKNAFDTPELCPEGTYKDHSGACQEPF